MAENARLQLALEVAGFTQEANSLRMVRMCCKQAHFHRKMNRKQVLLNWGPFVYCLSCLRFSLVLIGHEV